MIKVLKFLSISFFLVSSLYAKDLLSLRPAGYVNDFARVLDSDTKTRLEYLLSQVESQAGIEIAVVLVNTINDSSIEEAANELFQKWGIGKKGKDNGLLFITAVKERKTRIEVGYGLEEAINDSKAGSILDDFAVPYFKNNDFSTGVYTTTIALVDALTKYYKLNINLTEDETNIVKEEKPSLGSLIAYLFVLILLFRFFGPFLFLFLPFGGGGSFGGFGSGGGSFGGGFGGFGGGGSGGGGASRGF